VECIEVDAGNRREAGPGVIPFDKSAAAGAAISVAAAPTRHALLELSIGYGLILLAVWTPRPWQWPVNVTALCWILLVTGLSFEGWRAMGLRPSGAWRSFWVVGLALLLVAGAMALAGRLHTLHLPPTPALVIQRYWVYSIWAFLQEFLLLDFVLLHLLRLLSARNAAVIAAAGLFAFAHLPNPILTPATLIWGLASCWLFLRYRNLYTLALAHAIFGICMAITIPAPLTHDMKVGLSYLTCHPSAERQRSRNQAAPFPWVERPPANPLRHTLHPSPPSAHPTEALQRNPRGQHDEKHQ
jgi:membrane protease YdiL (CAAX protease family)